MKKKIFAIALAAFLFALSIVGSSVAYFTDVEKATNVFTAGDVNITLTYKGEVANEEASQGPISVTNNGVYPGQVFDINATITNVGSEEAYVGAIITLTKMDGMITEAGDADDDIPVAVSKFITALYTDADVQIVTSGDTITVYVVKADKLALNGTCVIFDDIVIPTSWDNDQMKLFSGFQLDVTAYATQVKGFANSVAAIKGAFGAKLEWAGYNFGA